MEKSNAAGVRASTASPSPLMSLLEHAPGSECINFMHCYVIARTQRDVDKVKTIVAEVLKACGNAHGSGGYFYHAEPFRLDVEHVLVRGDDENEDEDENEDHMQGERRNGKEQAEARSEMNTTTKSASSRSKKDKENSRASEKLYVMSCKQDIGESDEDMWFSAWLLKFITKTVPGIVASIRDEDGEVLTIECSESLPSWVQPPKPVTARNKQPHHKAQLGGRRQRKHSKDEKKRVINGGDSDADADADEDDEEFLEKYKYAYWVEDVRVAQDIADIPIAKRGFLFRGVLCGGRFVLISRDALPLNYESQTAHTITYNEVDSVIEYAKRKCNSTVAKEYSIPLETRLSGYPEVGLQRNRHNYTVLVNAHVAHIMRRAPWLITYAADAYYYRQPEHVQGLLNTLKRKYVIGHTNAPLVQSPVRFTRCAYAQFVLQERVDIQDYQVNPLTDKTKCDVQAHGEEKERISGIDSETERPVKCPYDIGMKLTVGLELLARGQGKREETGEFANKTVEEPKAIESDWREYLQALISQHLCTGRIGEERSFDAIDNARDAYKKVVLSDSSSESMKELLKSKEYELMLSPGYVVRALSTEICCELEYITAKLDDLGANDDSDDWLELDDVQLEQEIRERSRQFEGNADNNSDPKDSSDSGKRAGTLSKGDLDTLVMRMNKFIEASSGLEGIRMNEMNTTKDKRRMPGKFFPEDDGLEIETSDMIDALKKALNADTRQAENFSEDSESDDPLFGDENEEDQFRDEILCELSDRILESKREREASNLADVNDDEDLSTTLLNLRNELTLVEGSDSDDHDDIETASVQGGDLDSIKCMKEEVFKHPALSQSFNRLSENESATLPTHEKHETTELSPLDIDYNLVTNLMESVVAQEGNPGPASNLIKALGLDLKPQ